VLLPVWLIGRKITLTYAWLSKNVNFSSVTAYFLVNHILGHEKIRWVRIWKSCFWHNMSRRIEMNSYSVMSKQQSCRELRVLADPNPVGFGSKNLDFFRLDSGPSLQNCELAAPYKVKGNQNGQNCLPKQEILSAAVTRYII
jgi:hypothetical protein